MSVFRGTRITETYTMRIAAPPAKVFPLLCPEREKEWLDGWACEMIHSETGFAEPGCTFVTDLPPEGRAYWLMTRHEPPHTGEYVRFVPGLMFVVLTLRLAERDGGTALDIAYAHTGISAAGNAFIAREAGDNAARRFRWMENALNHYLATGEKLPRPA
jgi:hypothetical protein